MTDEHRMHLLPVVRGREAAFSYTCQGCGRCCYHKAIRVAPYAVARLADVLGTTTGDVLDRYIDPATSTLRQRDGGACVFYDDGCTVHAGRPLACRLYPLGWSGRMDGAESFHQLSGHPRSEGLYGTDGTVEGYLASQETAPYERASWRYAAVLDRLRRAAEADGPDPGDPPPMMDVDDALAADAEATGTRAPADVEARVERHLALLHQWLDEAGAPGRPHS